MAISTYKTFLMGKTSASGDWTKVADIKNFGDIGGSPNTLETTTLSDNIQTFINGIQQSGGAMEFTVNYTKAQYSTIKSTYANGEEYDFAVWFGGTESNGVLTPTGSEGKFSFKGMMSMYIPGKGVDEVVEAVLSIARSSVITEEFPT